MRSLKRTFEGALAVLTPDVVLMGSEAGELAKGLDEVRRLLEHLFSQPVSFRWTWKWREVSAAGPVAWVIAEATFGGTHPYRMTVVLEKRAGRWLWTQFHGSEPAPPYPTGGSATGNSP
jgi:ketosteroid isomerase-like protein